MGHTLRILRNAKYLILLTDIVRAADCTVGLSMHERTLADSIRFAGVGLHTGQPVSMELRPAPEGTGIVFRRVDLDDFEIPADVSSVARVAYATTLMRDGVWISTVEHVLSTEARGRLPTRSPKRGSSPRAA